MTKPTITTRQALRQLIAQGKEPEWAVNDLTDLCPGSKPEIKMVREAMGYIARYEQAASATASVIVNGIAGSLAQDTGRGADQCLWAAETWAIALGKLPAGAAKTPESMPLPAANARPKLQNQPAPDPLQASCAVGSAPGNKAATNNPSHTTPGNTAAFNAPGATGGNGANVSTTPAWNPPLSPLSPPPNPPRRSGMMGGVAFLLCVGMAMTGLSALSAKNHAQSEEARSVVSTSAPSTSELASAKLPVEAPHFDPTPDVKSSTETPADTPTPAADAADKSTSAAAADTREKAVSAAADAPTPSDHKPFGSSSATPEKADAGKSSPSETPSKPENLETPGGGEAGSLEAMTFKMPQGWLFTKRAVNDDTGYYTQFQTYHCKAANVSMSVNMMPGYDDLEKFKLKVADKIKLGRRKDDTAELVSDTARLGGEAGFRFQYVKSNGQQAVLVGTVFGGRGYYVGLAYQDDAKSLHRANFQNLCDSIAFKNE